MHAPETIAAASPRALGAWRALLFLGLAGFFAVAGFPEPASAAPTAITFVHDHHIFTLYPNNYPDWRRPKKQWYFAGMPADPPARLQTCGSEPADAPEWTYEEVTDWDLEAIGRTLQKQIGTKFDREPGAVTISRDGSGSIVFDGRGLPGRKIDLARAAALTKEAMEQNVATVVLPVLETAPSVTVNDEQLKEQGIKEVVTVGESVFSGSPKNRRHNIAVGVDTFNGHLIPQGEVFSFVETLGPVNASTGYLKELVIQGDQTIPDYGGGLCQVSSTAYRGPWEYGMPIVQRKNHSYAVTYYSPQGTDATIYPPSVDMKFRNDTPGALLIQSYTDEQDRAYFIYYGTKDDRKSEVFGPFISNRVGAPREEKIEYTTDLAPGERKKVGDRHDGMQVMWYRSVQLAGSGASMESYFSHYQTRQLYYLVGVGAGESLPATDGDLSEPPSWLPSR
jgi:vancomycin resistance protein YoaR